MMEDKQKRAVIESDKAKRCKDMLEVTDAQGNTNPGGIG